MEKKTDQNRQFRITVDQGGTFADGVLVDDKQGVSVAKAVTNPDDPAKSIMDCIQLLADERDMDKSDLLRDTTSISIGTTLATNAILEEKGANCCLLHTKGFRDVFELGRTIPKEDIYNLKVHAPKVLIPRYLRFGIEERIRFDGTVVTPLNENDVVQAIQKAKENRVDVPVVGFLHSYINPAHEEMAAEIVSSEYPDVVVSSHILRRWIEYDRISTASFAAYVKPKLNRFVRNLEMSLNENDFNGSLLFGTALGDVTTAEIALENPANIIGSGVANGALMARFLGEQADFKNVLSFDMGGTSADISVLYDRVASTTTDSVIGDQKNAMESIDVTSIGAGGGSIAWIDRMGVLRIGPESTGADPGPACYAKGGHAPCITDADVIMGYIPEDYFLGGAIRLDAVLAERVINEKIAKPLGIDVVEAAYSIVSLAETTMGEQVFLSIVEKGYNPRDFVLVTGGGAGPVHAVAMARRLGIERIYIPKHAAVFAALGGASADYGHVINRFLYRRGDQMDVPEIKSLYESMEKEAANVFERQGIGIDEMLIVRSAEMRYFGQLHDIDIPLPALKSGVSFTEEDFKSLIAAFHSRHEALYGWGDPKLPVVIALPKLRAIAKRDPLMLIRKSQSHRDASSAIKRQRNAYFREMGGYIETPCYGGELLMPGNVINGPAIIEEEKTTVVIPPKSNASVDIYNNYLVNMS